MPFTNNGLRVNIGCGATPTPGWLNFDNSPTVRIAQHPHFVRALAAAKLLAPHQVHFANIIAESGIRWADATKRIPLADSSVEVIYSSHMFEHLDKHSQVPLFLHEVKRVLRPDGILRLVVPDLRCKANQYAQLSISADAFMAGLHVIEDFPRSIRGRLHFLWVGARGHRWMYDEESLVNLLSAHGFRDALPLPPGHSRIPVPGPLDLFERQEESIYVEARNIRPPD